MKSRIVHPRLYAILPRPSISISRLSTTGPLTFFESAQAPSPPVRTHAHVSPREPKQQQQQPHPNPLALTPSPDSLSDQPSLSYNYHQHSSYHPSLSKPIKRPTKRSRQQQQQQQQQQHYTLHVGAYGIPKRYNNNPLTRPTPDPLHLAVQIGEDAYFIRDNAMGVADGVGGWARLHPSSSPTSPSPSALFAKRLMHFTSLQLSSLADNVDVDPGPTQDLDSHLDTLSEGIDILQIMERAYDATLNAHSSHTGSSTALVAVLDNSYSLQLEDQPMHTPQPVLKLAHIGDSMGMLVRDDKVVWRSEEMWWAFNTPVQLAPPPPPPPPSTSSNITNIASTFFSNPFSKDTSTSYRPFQPPPPKKPLSQPAPEPIRLNPRTTARVLTLPVQPDDILILASDGLSDNLWDEDVLDEVVRIRRTWGHTSSQPSNLGPVQLPTATATSSRPDTASSGENGTTALIDTSTLHRHTLAGMLSEALCSRARSVSERSGSCPPRSTLRPVAAASISSSTRSRSSSPPPTTTKVPETDDETPFSRRAKAEGRSFTGGKRDDISVLVAIISPIGPSSSASASLSAYPYAHTSSSQS